MTSPKACLCQGRSSVFAAFCAERDRYGRHLTEYFITEIESPKRVKSNENATPIPGYANTIS